MILILTEPRDQHANFVEPRLKARGAEVVRFNPTAIPTEAELSVAFTGAGRPCRELLTGDRTIDLDRLTSLWYRRPMPPRAPEAIALETDRRAVAGECEDVAEDLWNSLDCLVVPAPRPVFRRAQMKASQLRVAGEIGFDLPPTLITNSPARFLDFYRQHNGGVISKLAGFSFWREASSTFCRYTEPVSKRDVGYAHALRHCPLIFQAYVPKRVELRITVVGDQVFAAEIASQVSNRTRHDWRHYDPGTTPYTVHELPASVAARCAELVGRLGLCYGAIDMIVTPDGRYVFIEINPNGQYLWTELYTGLPITEALCDLLLAGKDRCWPSARANGSAPVPTVVPQSSLIQGGGTC